MRVNVHLHVLARFVVNVILNCSRFPPCEKDEMVITCCVVSHSLKRRS